MRVDHVETRPIPDTRQRPTVEVTLHAGSITATASVPSGKSTGSHEATELRDPDGGVSTALANVTGEIAEELVAHDFTSSDDLDDFLIRLDGTQNKSRLGANAILAVSIAAQRLFAQAEGIPLWQAIAKRSGMEPGAPRLYVNVMNGGVHADFHLPFQEYILVAGGPTSHIMPVIESAFTTLGSWLGNVPMGEEGGFSPTLQTLEEPFELLNAIIKEHPDLFIAIDAAATELRADEHSNGLYRLLGTEYSPAELAQVYEELVARYPLRSIEDPFAEDADDDFIALTKRLGKQCLIVGDDFTVTNPARIEHAVWEKALNAVLIKPNQIGTVREAIKAVQDTREAGLAPVCSHRSGETHDTFIADFAYGVGAYGIKAGGLGQHERLEKYDRLIAIEREAGGV